MSKIDELFQIVATLRIDLYQAARYREAGDPFKAAESDTAARAAARRAIHIVNEMLPCHRTAHAPRITEAELVSSLRADFGGRHKGNAESVHVQIEAARGDAIYSSAEGLTVEATPQATADHWRVAVEDVAGEMLANFIADQSKFNEGAFYATSVIRGEAHRRVARR